MSTFFNPGARFRRMNLKSGGVGATCAYKEKPFDRIIRLSKPVDLRNARIDPWRDTTVHSVDMFLGGKYKPAPSGNPLEGRVVSLGEKAKFIEDAGYPIDGMTLSIAPFLEARPAQEVSGTYVSIQENKAEYQKEKPARISAVQDQIDPVRNRVLADNMATGFDSWATSFTSSSEYRFSLDQQSLMFTAVFGGGHAMEPPSNYRWKAFLVFQRWDPDALGGRFYGIIFAQHNSTTDEVGSVGKGFPVRPR